MNEIKCFVIDDEMFAIRLLQKYIADTEGLQYIAGETNPIKALRDIRDNKYRPDVCFVDIEMKGLSGIDLAKELFHLDILVIFTTGHTDYLGNAFDIKVVDYLLKPFEYPRFLQAVSILRKRISERTEELPHIFVKLAADGSRLKIYCKEIVYVESIRNYCNFVTTSAVYTSYLSLKRAEEELIPYEFLRVHRSFLINFHRIKKIGGNILMMDNNTSITIGAVYKDEILNRVHAKLLTNRRARL